MTQKTNGMQADNCKNIESKNGMSQGNNIITEAEEEWRPATAKDYREGNKFEDEIRIGDRVYSRNYETMGTVVGRYWWNGDNCYRVRMDRECEGGFGRKFIVTSFHRDGLTKNIGNDGREIIGNAEYYRETLFASWWGFNGEPRTFSIGGQQIDICEKDGQEWEVVSHHQNGEPTRDTMTTGEVCEWLSRLYSKSQEPSLETSSEIRAYNVGDRVQRIGTGATGTIDDVNNYEGKRTYIVKYDETQRRQSDGFEFLTEEVFENEIEPAPFFTAGVKYRCIKSVKGDFTKGKVYEQSSDPTQWFGYFSNDQGLHHVWPQPDNIAHECELWGYKPEDIDPRNYFEPVSE